MDFYNVTFFSFYLIGSLGVIGCLIGFGTLIIERILDKEFDNPHYIANILWSTGFISMLIAVILAWIGRLFIW